MPQLALWIYAAVLGAVIGSFLNVCIWRLPAGESVVAPRSRCPACGHAIGWRDNIPVLSYLLLGGRCRGCGARISPQYPLVELASAAIWVAAVVRHGVSWPALTMALFFTLLLGIALTDARTKIIPHEFTMGGLAAGLLLALAPGGIGLVPALGGAALGFALLYGVGEATTRWMASRGKLPEGMDSALGGGDVWMMTMVGAFLGPWGVVLTIFLGAVAGVAVAYPVQWLRRERVVIPFGVFLALGAAAAYTWGDALWLWYRGYAGLS